MLNDDVEQEIALIRDTDLISDRDAPAGVDHEGLGLARRVWTSHRRWVAAILLAHKPREADLDDLLQSVATAVVRKIGDLRDPGAVRAWLRTVAINEARLAARERGRRRKGLRLVGQREQARPEPAGVGRSAEEAERIDSLMRLVAELPESYREPLMLRCVRGMSYRQIAAITGLKETTIETRIARGRRLLRELVEKSEREGAGTEREQREPKDTAAVTGGVS
ncbi:MAG: sigma-70 family RNA polymerase sigma factor [Planctomycetota bacterium]